MEKEFNLSDWCVKEKYYPEVVVKEFIQLVNGIVLRPDLDVVTKVDKIKEIAGDNLK